MRFFFEALCRLLLRVFFRRVEVVGGEGLPEGGLLLAPNHPNALVDPLVVMCTSPRPASFLAKAPLFDTPVVRTFIKALDSLPVYRAQDGFDTRRNKDTLAAARRILDAGGAIAIFPEGKSHDEPALEKLKTGPARIALGARSGGASVHVVPCGIFFERKGTFRSDVVMVFGEAIAVPIVELDDDGEPPFEDAKALTAELREGLEALLVQGESHEQLELVARASRIVRGAQHELENLEDRGSPGPRNPVENDRQLRQLLVDGHEHWSERAPARVAELSARIEVLDDLFEHLGLTASRTRSHEGGARWAVAVTKLGLLTLSAPFALAGALLHWLPYRAIGSLAARMAKQDGTVVSTMKILAGMLFFPLWWVVVALATGLLTHANWGLIVAVVLPSSAWLALRWLEGQQRARAWLRSVSLRFERADVHRYLIEERQAIYEELLAMGEAIDETSGEAQLA